MTASARLLAAASLAFGLAYPWLSAGSMGPAATIAVKGAAVGLLALAAVLCARTLDGWLLAGLLALGALGDVLLEIHFGAGAAAFAAGHIVAIGLYRRHRCAGVNMSQVIVAALLPAAAAAVPAFLLWGRPEAVPFIAYGLLLGAMAASAWLSRFPRRLVASGALLFLASDMLIAVRLGVGAQWLGLPVWYLYYAGQLLIFVGVSGRLRPA